MMNDFAVTLYQPARDSRWVSSLRRSSLIKRSMTDGAFAWRPREVSSRSRNRASIGDSRRKSTKPKRPSKIVAMLKTAIP